MSDPNTDALVTALELVPGLGGLWIGSRRGVELLVTLEPGRRELVARVRGLWPKGFCVKRRGVLELHHGIGTGDPKLDEIAVVLCEQPSRGHRLLGPASVRERLRALLELPDARVEAGAVHVELPEELGAARRAVELAAALATELEGVLREEALGRKQARVEATQLVAQAKVADHFPATVLAMEQQEARIKRKLRIPQMFAVSLIAFGLIGLMLEIGGVWLFSAAAALGGLGFVITELITTLLLHCPACGEGLSRTKQLDEWTYPDECPGCSARLR